MTGPGQLAGEVAALRQQVAELDECLSRLGPHVYRLSKLVLRELAQAGRPQDLEWQAGLLTGPGLAAEEAAAAVSAKLGCEVYPESMPLLECNLPGAPAAAVAWMDYLHERAEAASRNPVLSVVDGDDAA